MFPLQVLLLPGEEMKLHIFEKRYRQLLQDCEEGAPEFGIPYSENGKLTKVGTLVRLREIVQSYPNGTSDIVVEAVANFQMRRFYMHLDDKLYPGGEVKHIDVPEDSPMSSKLYGLLLRYHEKVQPGDPIQHIEYETLNEAARMAPLDSAGKLEFLKIKSAKDRDIFLRKLLKFELLLLEQGASIENGIYLN